MKTSHKVYIGDSRAMPELRNESVHLVVTSPPYWQLKDYGNGSQIGYNDSYEDYVNNLNLVWNECERVLHKGCRLCVNIGDQFARSVYYGRYKVIPIRTEIIRFCETTGFDYMGAIIWQKVTTTNTTGGATIMGSYPYPRNGILKIDYEFILIFKKPGRSPKVPDKQKSRSKLTIDEWNRYFSGHWKFSGEKQNKHLAMFPEELPKRLIKMFTFEGDTVLDPFLGSGTTSLAALNLGRNSVGYEINEEFVSVIEEKLGMNQGDMFKNIEIVFNKPHGEQMDFEEAVRQLPYQFKDPVQFERKVDPKKLKFGSKIDSADPVSTELFTVSSVVSPELIMLGNGLNVRLIGVKSIPDKSENAIRFIREKTKGQKVYLKNDSEKYDENGVLMCYVYLKNKTFLNAHLIKSGLVGVDMSHSFRYKEKFIAEVGTS